MKKPILLILGPPASGKTTLANWIAEQYPQQIIRRNGGIVDIGAGYWHMFRLLVCDDLNHKFAISLLHLSALWPHLLIVVTTNVAPPAELLASDKVQVLHLSPREGGAA